MSNSTTKTVWQPIWRDRAARIGLGLAVILNLLLFVMVLLTHQQLSEAMASAGDISDAIDGTIAPNAGQPFNVLILPIIGLVSWLVGLALGAFYYNVRKDPPMAYIVWAAVVLVDLATWVPALSLIFDL